LLSTAPDEKERFELDPERVRLLERIYRESGTELRKLLRYLADNPDRPIGTRIIAKQLELPRGTGSLAGMLGAFGRRSTNRYEGYSPIEAIYNPVKDATELSMPKPEAEVIRRIAKRRKVAKRPKRTD